MFKALETRQPLKHELGGSLWKSRCCVQPLVFSLPQGRDALGLHPCPGWDGSFDAVPRGAGHQGLLGWDDPTNQLVGENFLSGHPGAALELTIAELGTKPLASSTPTLTWSDRGFSLQVSHGRGSDV